MKARKDSPRLLRRATRVRLRPGLTRRFFTIFIVIAIVSAIAAYFANEEIEAWEHLYALEQHVP